jgi:hypothetical protein
MCLDITRDVMTMRRAGRPLPDARRMIDGRYRGTPTPTPYPKG